MEEETELRTAFRENDHETIFDITGFNPSNKEEAKMIINQYLGEELI